MDQENKIDQTIIDNKFLAMLGIIILGFIQLGGWYMGFNGQVTVMVTGAITYLMGIITKAGYDKYKSE